MNNNREQIASLFNTLEPYITEGVKIILVVFLFVAPVLFLTHSSLAIGFPYPLDYGEAPLIDQAIRLAAGENIYRPDISSPPYTIANYPPVYVFSLVPFLNLLESPFHVARLISVLATVATAIFLALTVHTFTKDRWASLTTGVFFLGVPYVVYWSGLARIDSLALAFATASLFVLARSPKSLWALLGGALLFVAAAYTRQSYALAAPLAGFVWLWTQDRRKAVMLAGVVGGLGVLLFVFLNMVTNGGFFYNIITANVNEFGFDRLQWNLEDLWSLAPIALIFGGIFLFTGWRGAPAWPMFGAFLVGATISTLTIGKIGSNVNYFLELAAALSLVAGAILVWSKRFPWRNAVVTILLAFQIGMFLQNTMDVRFDWHLIPRIGDLEALQRLERMVEDIDGVVLADEYMGMLTIQDRPLYMQPFEVTRLAADGLWDQGPLLVDLTDQKFDGILIHHFNTFPVHKERWSTEMLAAIETNYRPVRTLAGTLVYVPLVEESISQVPFPQDLGAFEPVSLETGSLLEIGRETFVGEPYIAVNPTDPEKLAAVFTSVSKFNCALPNCKITLKLYMSNDGGESWASQSPFSPEQQAMFNGAVAYGPDGILYVVGIRDGAIVINWSDEAVEFEMSRSNYEELTKAQVAARPWLRIHPVSGTPYITLDAQEEDFTFVTPSLLRAAIGEARPTTSRVDQHIAIADFSSPRGTWPDDIQVLFGQDEHVSLVWTWGTAPWVWPRTVWMANSTDGGVEFGEPTPILETWGPINTAFHDNQYAIVYRVGTEEAQHLAVAITADHGKTWNSSIASGEVPIYFDVDKAPGINMAPDGTIDLVFYAHDPGSVDCVLTVDEWLETLPVGRVDPCNYNVYYTFSEDGGSIFSRPVQLNDGPIRGDSFIQVDGGSQVGSHIAVASSDSYAYPIWIGTPQTGKTQAYTVQIKR